MSSQEELSIDKLLVVSRCGPFPKLRFWQHEQGSAKIIHPNKIQNTWIMLTYFCFALLLFKIQYIKLPEWQWNAAMLIANQRAGRRLALLFLESLYGNPSACLFWERKSRKVLHANGFEDMVSWKLVFIHNV